MLMGMSSPRFLKTDFLYSLHRRLRDRRDLQLRVFKGMVYYRNSRFDDHGSYNLDGDTPADINPAIPLGAGRDNTRCTPYIFGYTFDSLARTREEANRNSAQAYSIIVPGVFPTDTINGGDGEDSYVTITGHNYGFSVSGAIDNSSGGPYLAFHPSLNHRAPKKASFLFGNNIIELNQFKDAKAPEQQKNALTSNVLYDFKTDLSLI